MARQKKWCSKLSFRGNKYTKCRIGPSSTVTSKVRNTPSPISASGKNLSPGFGQFDQFSASTRNIILSLENFVISNQICVACKDCGSQVYLDEDIENRRA